MPASASPDKVKDITALNARTPLKEGCRDNCVEKYLITLGILAVGTTMLCTGSHQAAQLGSIALTPLSSQPAVLCEQTTHIGGLANMLEPFAQNSDESSPYRRRML